MIAIAPALTPRRLGAVALLAAIAAGSGSAGAQRRNRADNAVHGTPVATNTIAQSPERFYGTVVTVSAAVEHVLSSTVFLVDQRKVVAARAAPAGAPLLVIAPALAEPLTPNRYLLVSGEVVRLDAAGAAMIAGNVRDVPADVLDRYRGQPALVAASIIDATYRELAKPPAAGGTPAGATP